MKRYNLPKRPRHVKYMKRYAELVGNHKILRIKSHSKKQIDIAKFDNRVNENSPLVMAT